MAEVIRCACDFGMNSADIIVSDTFMSPKSMMIIIFGDFHEKNTTGFYVN